MAHPSYDGHPSIENQANHQGFPSEVKQILSNSEFQLHTH